MSISDKLIIIAENQQNVFNAGEKLQYDVFWDNFQDYGKRTNYQHTFLNNDNTDVGTGWNDKNFIPKYDMRPVGSNNYMFYRIGVGDFKRLFEESEIVIDFANVTKFQYGFAYSKITQLGILDFSECVNLTSAFEGCKNLISIDKLKLRDDGDVILTQAFTSTPNLENILIEGCIGNKVDFGSCSKLSKDSIISIVNALSNTVDSYIVFSKVAIENAFGSIGNTEWLNLIKPKYNWNVILV